MDYILNILLISILILLNYIYFKNHKMYQKIKKIVYVLGFISLVILIKLSVSSKEKFVQTGGRRLEKIEKLKFLCGIPENDESTSHCFADGTHQTCCLLGPKAREYSMESGNEIGSLSVESYKKFKKQNPNLRRGEKQTTPWCTCLGSGVCSDYARKFKDGTRVKLINNRFSPNKIALNPKSRCELYYGDKFRTKRHLTPGVNTISNSKNCKFGEKDVIKNINKLN